MVFFVDLKQQEKGHLKIGSFRVFLCFKIPLPAFLFMPRTNFFIFWEVFMSTIFLFHLITDPPSRECYGLTNRLSP